MPTVPKKQLAVRLSLPMAAAAQECAWQADRMRKNPESSGYIQRWLEEIIEQRLREWGFWPPNELTYAGKAPRSPHTGRIPDAVREARTEARIERALEHERARNGGLTDRELHAARGGKGNEDKSLQGENEESRAADMGNPITGSETGNPVTLENVTLPNARTREDFQNEDPPPLPELPADEAHGDEEDGNIL